MAIINIIKHHDFKGKYFDSHDLHDTCLLTLRIECKI